MLEYDNQLSVLEEGVGLRRDTPQREAIRGALVDAGRPLSVSELFKLAHNKIAGLGIATIYRNLKALQLEGRVVQVALPGQPPRWEVSLEGHHHHFLCRMCDRLFEVYSCPEDIKRLLPKGYVLEKHDILLSGQCDACATKSNKAANPSFSKKVPGVAP